jgi:hypothetical protein
MAAHAFEHLAKIRCHLHLVLVIACAVGVGCSLRPTSQSNPPASTPTSPSSDTPLARAFEQHLNNVPVEGQGVVSQVLADDNEGDRHQRFIVELHSGQTVLILHNLDLTPRIAGLSEGDVVSFSGEYVWNDQGGMIHWTHRDPNKHHRPGWIRHNGVLYQ